MKVRFAFLAVRQARCRRPTPAAGVALARCLWRWGLAATICLAAGCATPPKPSVAPSQASVESLATFDAAWERVHESFFDPGFRGNDWVALREKYRPRAAQARNPDELRPVIQSMLDRLGQSHMRVLPGSSLAPEAIRSIHSPAAGVATEPGRTARLSPRRSAGSRPQSPPAPLGGSADFGFDVRRLGGDYVVVSIAADSPASAAGIHRGWILERIDGVSTRDYVAGYDRAGSRSHGELLAWSRLAQQLRGPAGSSATLEFRDETNRRRSLELERKKLPGQMVKLGYLPAMFASSSHERIQAGPARAIGVIRFNLWMLPLAEAIDTAVDDLRDCSGLVIDLRGNIGGVAGMIMGIAGHFLDQPVLLGTLETRDSRLQFHANPRLATRDGRRVAPHAGPLAILVDRHTVSASEIFAGSMQGVGRARIFGETTAGEALPAHFHRLPNGDLLLHAFADFRPAGGLSIEGRGVAPDTQAPWKRRDLLAGRDAALEAACRWIIAQSPHPGI